MTQHKYYIIYCQTTTHTIIAVAPAATAYFLWSFKWDNCNKKFISQNVCFNSLYNYSLNTSQTKNNSALSCKVPIILSNSNHFEFIITILAPTPSQHKISQKSKWEHISYRQMDEEPTTTQTLV
jgi:hypothetical protein